MEIKMIVLDLDGTILHDDKSLSDYSKDIIQKCRKKGIKVIFATVRGTIDDVVPLDLFDGYVIKSGALAYDSGTLIYKRVMSINDVRGLLLACDKAGLKIIAENSDDGICYTNFSATDVSSKKYEIANFTEMKFNSDKIYIIIESAEAVNIIKKNLPKGVHLFVSRDNFAFISHEEAVKSKAAAALAKRWDIKRENIVSFGDDLIDIDILQYSGIGVATGNALLEVKEVADYICDTNNNDGVAKWIEERIL